MLTGDALAVAREVGHGVGLPNIRRVADLKAASAQTGNVAVEQGLTIYQRILTWIINKISRTILKAAFVAIAFIVTGKFVVSAFAMLLLVFMTDFAKISLATNHVRSMIKWRVLNAVVKKPVEATPQIAL
jgi:magnesium-transporting ATPase (P-type)